MSSVAVSFWSAHGIDVAPYGLLQIILFAGSTVVAGFSAFKGLSAGNIWTGAVGGLVILFLVIQFCLLCVLV